MFCSFFPPKFFSKTLSVCHYLLFFSLPFQHSMFFLFSSIPFQIIFSLCFVGSIFVAPFLSSFLLLSFQPLSCHPLLQSTLLSFLVVWLFYSSCLHDTVLQLGVSFFNFLVGFCLLSSDCCCHFIFSLLGLFFRLSFFVKLLWPLLFWFRIMTPAILVVFFGGRLCNTNLSLDVLLVLTWGSGVLKNKALNNGMRFCCQLWGRCVCLLLTGRGGALN